MTSRRPPLEGLPALRDDTLLRALRGECTDRVPAWMMRQAGRYLPEFRDVRAAHGFFEVCRDPALACEVTVQPLERFGAELLSACIIFSDILVVLQALGVEVRMEPKEGPVLPVPLASPDADAFRALAAPAFKGVDVERELGYVFDAIGAARQRIAGRVPLIGFSGAPFTLMGYWVEGGGSRTLSKAKRWLYEWPRESHVVLQRLTDVVVDYLVGQVRAGAQALQVFESNGGDLAPRAWSEFSLPYLAQICKRVKERLAGELGLAGAAVPVVVFSRGSNWEGALEALRDAGFDAVSLDWTVDPAAARERVGDRVALQGNLCPALLYAREEVIRAETHRMLDGFRAGACPHVANLGHGMEPEMDPDRARCFLQAVRDYVVPGKR